MSIAARVFLLWLAVLAPAHAAEREITRKFAVQPGCVLKVDTYRGRVTIEEKDTTEISLTLFLEAGVPEKEAKQVFEGVEFDAKAEGNTVAVRVRNPRETRALWTWQQDRQVDLDFKFTVPRQCSVDVTVGQGSITVGNLAGNHRARIDGGAIFFRRIDGSIDARVETGGIVVSRCTGALTARAVIGTVRAGTVGGRAELRTDSGDVELLAARAGATVQAAAGNVVVGFPEGGRGDIRATADGGSVVARIEPDAQCRIDAAASWGRVESKLPLSVETGALGKAKLTARIGDGGPQLVLRSSGGNVRIEKLEFEVELTEPAAQSPAN